MNKDILLKTIRSSTRGNHFSMEIPQSTKGEGILIHKLANELNQDGKIRLKECTSKENSIFLVGILKYASE